MEQLQTSSLSFGAATFPPEDPPSPINPPRINTQLLGCGPWSSVWRISWQERKWLNFRLQVRGCCSWLVRTLLSWGCHRSAVQGMSVSGRCPREGSGHGWMLRELRDIPGMETPQIPAGTLLRAPAGGLQPRAAACGMPPPENARGSMT